MREARGPAWTDWLHDRGLRWRWGQGSTRARSFSICGRAGAMRSDRAFAGDASLDEALAAVRKQPPMAARALAPEVSVQEGAIRVLRTPVAFGSRSSTTGASGRSLNRLAWAGAAVTVYPHDVDAGEAHSLRRRPALERAGRPCAADARDRHGSVQCSGRVPRPRHLPRPPAARDLATGHDTFKLPFGHRGANHPVVERRDGPRSPSRARTTASRSTPERSARGRDPRLSLRRHGQGARPSRGLRARSVQFHPEARPGAGADTSWGWLDGWVEEVSGLAKAGVTSTRSA